MWTNLTDDQRQRIKDAGTAPNNPEDVENTPHRDLFYEYFRDNCDDANDRLQWECYWWLKDQGPSLYGSRNREVESKFEQMYSAVGATPIQWPPEIVSWYETREQLRATAEGAWLEKWDDDPDTRKGEAYEKWQDLNRQFLEWLSGHQYPFQEAYNHCRRTVSNWYKAYFDEIARMHEIAMPHADLDLDFIDSLNKKHLDELETGSRATCIGYGHYVLIGDFPPGYIKSVTSYDQHWAGALTMKQKGGAFGPGKVVVTGCDVPADQKWFKEAFRRASKKAITFD
jgi:hypothetical protein